MQNKVARAYSGQLPPVSTVLPTYAVDTLTAPLQLLQFGSLRAEISPGIGGCLASLFTTNAQTGEARHWLRPATPTGLVEADPLQMASFPMLPWSNRIRDGRFTFEGRSIQLPPHPTLGPNSIHGLGWAVPWQIGARSNAHLELRLTHDKSSQWPFMFSATQTYTLDEKGLRIDITVTNESAHRIPADIGHHPYLPHDRSGRGTRLTAQVQGMWESDEDLLPTKLTNNHPAITALQNGMRLSDFELDNNFCGYGGLAEVLWPNGDRLHMQSSAPMNFFVLYCPKDQDTFCMEPVSNCTDWLNLQSSVHAKEAGGNVLEPGQTLRGHLRLDPIPANEERQHGLTL
jgi:aldose 1-epimerase